MFVGEEVTSIIEKVCKACLADSGFLHSKVRARSRRRLRRPVVRNACAAAPPAPPEQSRTRACPVCAPRLFPRGLLPADWAVDGHNRGELLERAERTEQAVQIRWCAACATFSGGARAAAVARSPSPAPVRRSPPPPARAVTTTLTQKTGASVQTATSQYWDLQRDSYVAYKYENEQMQALTTVFGVSI